MRNLFTKRLAALAGAAALSLALLAGCSPVDMENSGAASSEPKSSAPASPVTVQDAAGKDVVIKEAPQRVVILPVWEGEMALDMIDADRIAALSSYMDSTALTACADKAKAVSARVNSEAEAILGQAPDLVLLDTFNDADGSLAKALTDAKVTVLTLSSPITFADIRDRLSTVAKALYAEEKGQALIDEMDKRLNDVKAKVEGVEAPLGVMYYEDYYSADGSSAGMLCAYGKDSPFNAIAEAAGAVNVCTAANYSAVSKETVVNDWKPGLLVVPGIVYDANFQPAEDGGAAVTEAIKKDSVLQSLPAVQNGRIIALTEKYRGSTSHYMAYAVEELAKACYPDRF